MRGKTIKQMLNGFVKEHRRRTVTNRAIQMWILKTYNIHVSGKKLVKYLNKHDDITPIKDEQGHVKYFIRDPKYEEFKGHMKNRFALV
jgi:hypothetical protein